MNEFFQSKVFQKLTAILGILLIALLIFWAGLVIGAREEHSAGEWNAYYIQQFGGPSSPFVPNSDHDDAFITAHGAFGQIVGVRLPTVIIKGSAESEKTVTVSGNTVIRRFHELATSTDLVPGETVVVLGEPDGQGGITASLIRIMPSATSSMPN